MQIIPRNFKSQPVFFACCRAEMIANDKILAFDRSVVLVGVALVKISLALIKQISKETVLKIGGRLFSDALSERGVPAKSYVTMF